MLDFLLISTKATKNGLIEIYPKFIIKKSQDLMVRGSDFYAIWVEERGLWSDDEQDALQLIDKELDDYARENKDKFNANVKVLHMWDAETGMIDAWHKYCQRQMRDSYNMLDEKLIFSNSETNKKDYASKRLSYPLEPGDISAFNKLLGTLYSETERHKIEWAIGAIVTGDSKKLQKFMVFYGAAGTGKSTVINIIQQLFCGYFCTFSSKDLGSSSQSFALEAFKTNPLIAIEHDGDLSRIEDNSRLNSLVSHELMSVNEKFKSTYSNAFKCFLILGTNRPVKITDGRSGLLRRLIDVHPTGNKFGIREYERLVKHVEFELGAIAYHCRDVYLSSKDEYNDYVPIAMLGASNDFYNFVLESYPVFGRDDRTTLKAAWAMYKTYCEQAKVPYGYSMRVFKEELKNYFEDFKERIDEDDGCSVKSVYSKFKRDKFEWSDNEKKQEELKPAIIFEDIDSIFDKLAADYPAQYSTEAGTPTNKWSKVKTKLSDINTKELHYVKVPENHIVIDFDLTDKDGNKSFELNIKEAAKFPPTYAELSKSGAGIHLHYIYDGDVDRLSRVYDYRIEVKVFTGNSSLRRKLTKCNNLDISTINSGLPLKGGDKMVNFEAVKSEKALRTLIKRNLNKEIHGSTKPSVDFIFKILEDTYASDLSYDVSDLRQAILAFAANSTNQSEYCLKLVTQMKFKSEDISEPMDDNESPIVFYDVEVFPNLFLVNWKLAGEEKPVVRMINPGRDDIESILRYRLVGFNCRRYDNHILYARYMGYSNEQLYSLSRKIVNAKKGENKGSYFGEAYNISYTDVYDFSAKKQSLKKWEIELGIHHQELGLPWDEPVPEERWEEVAEYCDNDVLATEAVFNHLKGDWTARHILADLAGASVNDTTNTLTTKIVFSGNRHPQEQSNYRFMGVKMDEPINDEDYVKFKDGKPIFPNYTFEGGKSIYRGEEVGEGGYVYAEPGIYGNVALLDIASMHPSSIIAENLFGDEYTRRFKDVVEARVAIKHKDFDKAKTMLHGALAKYLDDEENASALAGALKIAINSVYGLTSAGFENPFRDNRNIDNIVAKRGSLFMINLKHEIQRRGFIVAHIKTDSIKIPDATPEIIQFVMDFGKMYGYTFEHEATYDRMCLVNDAVYIAKYKDGKDTGEWTATGTQFAVPYVFKTCFTKEDILFDDVCETKAVSGTAALYLDMNEGLSEDQHDYRFIGKVGRFCPIKLGKGGGELFRYNENKYSAAAGTKGYRWLEAEMVQTLGKEDEIDISYYDRLVTEAITTISLYGDYNWFVSDDPYVEPEYVNGKPVYEDTIPF